VSDSVLVVLLAVAFVAGGRVGYRLGVRDERARVLDLLGRSQSVRPSDLVRWVAGAVASGDRRLPDERLLEKPDGSA